MPGEVCRQPRCSCQEQQAAPSIYGALAPTRAASHSPPSHLSAGRGPRPALTELPAGDTSCEEAARRPRLPHRSLPPAVVPSSWRRGAPRGPFFSGLVPRCRARPERRTAVPACAQPAPEHRGQQEEEKAEEEETSRWAWSRGQCPRSGFGLEELTLQR